MFITLFYFVVLTLLFMGGASLIAGEFYPEFVGITLLYILTAMPLITKFILKGMHKREMVENDIKYAGLLFMFLYVSAGLVHYAFTHDLSIGKTWHYVTAATLYYACFLSIGYLGYPFLMKFGEKTGSDMDLD